MHMITVNVFYFKINSPSQEMDMKYFMEGNLGNFPLGRFLQKVVRTATS